MYLFERHFGITVSNQVNIAELELNRSSEYFNFHVNIPSLKLL
jgi:hypothetical protein